MRWTEEQDDVLREVSFHGAAFAAAEIARRHGVAHTVRAVAKTHPEPTGGLPVAPPCARPCRGGCVPGATGGAGCGSTHEA